MVELGYFGRQPLLILGLDVNWCDVLSMLPLARSVQLNKESVFSLSKPVALEFECELYCVAGYLNENSNVA